MERLNEMLARRFVRAHAGPPAAHDDEADALPPRYRDAAVLIAVTERREPGVLLTHRPATMRAHAGQVAFPGGKIDAGESAIEAALREAEEELGIARTLPRVIGTSDIYRSGSGYAIVPVLATVPPDLVLEPNPHEVESWFEAPLRHLVDPRNHVRRSVEWQGRPRSYWEINWRGHRIWGVTAGIVVNLVRRMRRNG